MISRRLNYGREEPRMKERLTRNIGLKILSLLVAVLLWIVILNIDDPVIAKNFHDIPVTKLNENALKQKDKVYEVVTGDTVDVTVKGKRSIIESLKTSDFQAIADLSQLSVVNAVPIEVTVPKYGDNVEIDQKNSTMTVNLENLKTEQFRIDVVEKGTAAEGYYVKETTTSPNIIQVSGAQSVIDKIKEVVVEVDVSNARKSFQETVAPKVYDKNGSLMDSSNITLSYEDVEVSVNLLQTKTVNLYIQLTGTPPEGYEYVKFEYEPKQVVIAGEQNELDKVQYIMGEYNIDNQREDLEDEVNITDFITNDVILIDENQNAVINLDVEKMDSKDISMSSGDVDIKNLPDGTIANFNTEGTITVKIFGKKEVLATINKYNINPYIDLKDTKTGTRVMDIQFDPPDNSIIISDTSISVTINKTSG